jgi:hypothetical protein
VSPPYEDPITAPRGTPSDFEHFAFVLATVLRKAGAGPLPAVIAYQPSRLAPGLAPLNFSAREMNEGVLFGPQTGRSIAVDRRPYPLVPTQRVQEPEKGPRKVGARAPFLYRRSSCATRASSSRFGMTMLRPRIAMTFCLWNALIVVET